jgi:membrane-associated phospholipid phosphatase
MPFLKQLKTFVLYLDTTDMLNAGFFAMMTVMVAIFASAIPLWWLFVALNLAIIVAIFLLADFASTRTHFWKLLHGFYMMACIPIVYKEVYYLGPAMNPRLMDSTLIAIDHALFGVHPTQWLAAYRYPFVTEILQLAYSTFYLLPLVLAVDLYRKRRMQAFRLTFLTVILAFYLSYIGYLAVPAIGPRFTLHEFSNKDKELPGVWLATTIRGWLNRGENISPGMEHPERVVQRDCFPSGHTQITLVVIFLAFRYRARSRWCLSIVGSLLILATVYLRYHYVVDVAAGIVFAAATYPLMLLLDRWWCAMRTEPQPNSA